jgi:O-acetyl-ADP-ribose deacetylase (regulator of RNase III)
MAISCVSGDLLTNAFAAVAFAHGCNCAGAVGAGIALGFRMRYPAMYEEHRRRCKGRSASAIRVMWSSGRTPTSRGASPWRQRRTTGVHARPLGRWSRRWRLCELADVDSVRRIAMPRIGAGYGGLTWPHVREIVERVFADWIGSPYVYEEYAPETVDLPMS